MKLKNKTIRRDVIYRYNYIYDNTPGMSTIQLLSNAVIEKAVEDYRTYLKTGYLAGVYEIEEFFRSERFKIMTNVSGDYLIKKIKEEAKDEADQFCKRGKKAMRNLSQQSA